ncbi:acyl-CoA N-acyltransferase [Cucurbitaria berberidis CBS 394.84]|uniref:Acyl-CoA N-acyltransferase n=1 Tax=Cucurbitaria berberidis CBS 394.84 TaxID=1168544 RepID=A0A9P4GN18_9PLEO|nr:acyl-CoA N-acyltransferase [Cucurbitaria berberidis CBS 394.84]KAF1848202.1 acyl-CoA N-acyltransferase [Cucurbitaria berberidis CBS 394.84]
MASPFVRPYDASLDYTNGLNVFLTTIDPSLNWEPARTIGSHLWYKPYTTLTPGTCFVLDDGSGRVVGYCIGAANTASFAQRWRNDFTPMVDSNLIPRPGVRTGDALMEREDIKGFRSAVYGAECSMLLPWPAVLAEYPAHMHIDILPEFQRRGLGTLLMNAFLQAVRGMGARGVHLDMVRTNTAGRAFYTKIGFEICAQVMDGGASGDPGVDGIVMTLVKAL